MARMRVKQLGGSMRGNKPHLAIVDEIPATYIRPRAITHLFVGERRRMDHWMREAGINPAEHGRSVAWAKNGPQQLLGAGGPIEIVYQHDYTITDEDRDTIIAAEIVNTVF